MRLLAPEPEASISIEAGVVTWTSILNSWRHRWGRFLRGRSSEDTDKPWRVALESNRGRGDRAHHSRRCSRRGWPPAWVDAADGTPG